jgi:hypothetical protein
MKKKDEHFTLQGTQFVAKHGALSESPIVSNQVILPISRKIFSGVMGQERIQTPTAS